MCDFCDLQSFLKKDIMFKNKYSLIKTNVIFIIGVPEGFCAC